MGSATPGGDDSFEDRLGRFLLIAHASGAAVEGEWNLRDIHRMVPDVEVVIDRAVTDPDGSGSADGPARPPGFEGRLHAFVLERFSEGDDIEGVWTIRYPRETVPDWDVTITLDDAESVGIDERPPDG